MRSDLDRFRSRVGNLHVLHIYRKNEIFSPLQTSALELKSAVSCIANELLENAIKFNCSSSLEPIVIQLQVMPDRLIFTTTNSIDPQTVESFQTFLNQLIESDPQELYVSTLGKIALEDDRVESHIGYVTMMTDYGVKLGSKARSQFNRSRSDTRNVSSPGCYSFSRVRTLKREHRCHRRRCSPKHNSKQMGDSREPTQGSGKSRVGDRGGIV
ncbi:MAG: hypothetical protein WBB29_08605 [Geitlerinemataceae cyanobacterium]